jgi:hypothetical protein
MNVISNQAFMKRVTYIFYRFVMPLITIILLLGVASITTRPKLLGNLYADVIIRVILALWFCGVYLRLSRISDYRLYKNIEWEKTDVGPVEKYILIGFAFFGGCVGGIFTWGILNTLIPNSSTFVIVSAILNGFIIMSPLVTQYWVIKI